MEKLPCTLLDSSFPPIVPPAKQRRAGRQKGAAAADDNDSLSNKFAVQHTTKHKKYDADFCFSRCCTAVECVNSAESEDSSVSLHFGVIPFAGGVRRRKSQPFVILHSLSPSTTADITSVYFFAC